MVIRNLPSNSGWRAIDSMVLEITIPFPIDAPNAAKATAIAAAIA